jgi:outer membrane lipoprotein SlyB
LVARKAIFRWGISTLALSVRFTRQKRCIALAMACMITLAGCAGQMGGPPLTPAQQQLKSANARFNQTVTEGALAGALILGLIGAGVGAAAGGGKGAAIGGASGLALGGVIGATVGYNVARKNYAQANTETNLKQLIAEANGDAVAYSRSAQASREIAAEARRKIAALDAQYRAKTITAEQYKQSTQSYRESSTIMNAQLASTAQKMAEMRADAQAQSGTDRSSLLNDAAQVDAARRALKESSDSLAATLSMVPS